MLHQIKWKKDGKRYRPKRLKHSSVKAGRLLQPNHGEYIKTLDQSVSTMWRDRTTCYFVWTRCVYTPTCMPVKRYTSDGSSLVLSRLNSSTDDSMVGYVSIADTHSKKTVRKRMCSPYRWVITCTMGSLRYGNGTTMISRWIMSTSWKLGIAFDQVWESFLCITSLQRSRVVWRSRS